MARWTAMPALLLMGLGWPVQLSNQAIAQGTDYRDYRTLGGTCPNASWPGKKFPQSDDEFEALITAAKQWQPAAGQARTACVLMVAAIFALYIEKRYPDKAEAARRYDLIINRALGNCPNGWVC